MWWLRVILVVVVVLLLPFPCRASTKHACPPSSCGKISNISYPFRLKNDPKHCGDNRYELSCENNVTTILYLYSSKYHVQSINYNNFTIRLVDPGIQQSNCSSLPFYSLSRSDFCDTYTNKNNIYDDDNNNNNNNCADPYQVSSSGEREHIDEVMDSNGLLFEHIVYLNCSHQVTNNHKYVDTVPCINQNSKGYYIYAIAGDLIARDFQVGCHIELVAPTSWFRGLKRKQISYDVIHKALVYGFEISWMNVPCKNLCGDSLSCFFNSSHQLQCDGLCHTFTGAWTTDSCGKVYYI
ncbi:LEAF RUST 10 DISEASE-RESISTANCE LOCUS RECEPTOR-LIKE PROTEIN KINASE 2.1 [Trifolium repens]|nr:LEAF RUST 10 DISEASE-RESISTANCE LOCUS RECEPTOR-LIKE PROTEIN KINASE 2.1 [Trifolium repens]